LLPSEVYGNKKNKNKNKNDDIEDRTFHASVTPVEALSRNIFFSVLMGNI